MTSFDPTLYLVSDPSATLGLVPTVLAAVEGGATLVQLRDKHATTDARADMARALIAALTPNGVPLIVNDDIEAAARSGAAGVHVGQSDASAREARGALGPDAIIGLSVESFAQLERVPWDAVDYLGVGPVHATMSKADAAPPIGHDGLARIAAAAPKPVVAIGGVTERDAAALKDAGVAGLAVISAICTSPDPRAAACALRAAWRDA